jgi:nicotinamide-nucleotide adenylyltransferase
MHTRGLYVGRFQPFHLGHGYHVNYVLGEVEEIIIAVGSPQLSHELNDPFTTGERISMIRLALLEMGVSFSKYYIIPIPDANTHAIWTAQVITYSPSFDIVYSNDPLTCRLFKETGIKVKNVPLFRREMYSATEARRRILSNQNWEELLHKNVAKFIKQIDGDHRIRELAGSDKR